MKEMRTLCDKNVKNISQKGLKMPIKCVFESQAKNRVNLPKLSKDQVRQYVKETMKNLMKNNKTQITINASEMDLASIVLSALRYALPRQTYIPITIQEFIKKNINLFANNDLLVMLRDIEEAENNGLEYGLGSPTIDRPEWLQFKKWLQVELEGRTAPIDREW